MQQLKCLLLIRIQNDTTILEKLLFLTFKHTSRMQHMSPYSLWNRGLPGAHSCQDHSPKKNSGNMCYL